METKICTKCGIEKPLAEFYKRSDRKTGHRSHCRACTKNSYKQYGRALAISCGVGDTETRVCTKCGIEKPLSEFHRDAYKRGGRRSQCKECRRELVRQFYRRNKDHLCEGKRQYNRRLKTAAFEAYGGCICADPNCDEGRIEILTIDHIGGGGNKHRRGIGVGSGVPFYRWLRDHNYPPGFQVLCFNHNLARTAGEKEGHWRGLKVAAFDAYGGPVCAGPDCGVTDIACLTIDHIDGGGNRHRKETGPHSYRWLKRHSYPPGYQVLCHNCNILKYLNGDRLIAAKEVAT